MAYSFDENKYEDNILNESGTWNVKKDQLLSLITTSSGSIVSPLIYCNGKQTIGRISLQTNPSSNGKVSLSFNLKTSAANSNAFKMQIRCSQPYINKMSDYSSLSEKVDTTALLSSNTVAFQYAINQNKKDHCFTQPRSNDNLIQQGYSYSTSTIATLPSHYKPIQFDCSINSTLFTEVSKKSSYNNQEWGVSLLKCIRDPFTNTSYFLYLCYESAHYNSGYCLKVQPQHDKADYITAWFDIQCPHIMWHESRRVEFKSKTNSYQERYFAPESVANLPSQATITIRGHIFGQQWRSTIYCNNYEYKKDITSGVFLPPISKDSRDNNDALITKMNKMSDQIQQLTADLNKMRNTVNRLNNNNNTNINQEMKNKLDSMSRILNEVLNTTKNNDDEKGNNNDNDNVIFDPVYAQFYYWINNTVCLPQYLDKLKKSGYDSMDAVVELTDNDLQEIGVSAKGHRVRLLKAIKKYSAKDAKEGTAYI